MKSLKYILKKKSGRGSKGRISVRHQGGREKRFYRDIDFKREKKDVWGFVGKIEYDPNRNAPLALLTYEDGDKRYIISPAGLKVGDRVISSISAPIEKGNNLPLEKIPVGTQISCIEIVPGKGAQMVKGAGSFAVLHGKEIKNILVKLPSGEIKRFRKDCWAMVGQVGNPEFRNVRIGKAGTKRHLGIRPTVRGVAMHPNAHPHGGGEGRSGIGLKYPKTPWGKKAVGKTRKKRKYSNHMIVQGRKAGKHSNPSKIRN
ncbi:MAG: 50S ribosomal protein L2 [Candidatus Woesebacteria bacterium GW2011_GWC1_38_13]|uniref:Large ribosomal subunit protein uL2 n=1 Tax=Candidatus Woesebacteria bacterium GW2011_GWC1_38_13 TaxID=1618583 RepID=A0A0G0ILY0_9BACT|nr:MAG: 50S ribosomal protein L2 [Candidatus Woesebacteria bacterium GW2011_GWC1_38_13]